MKKTIIGLAGVLLIAGCTSTPYEPDLDEAKVVRDENRQAMRMEYGCPMTDDHATYRQCVLATYARQSPHTFTTTVLEDGRPVAVFSSADIMTNRGQPVFEPVAYQEVYEAEPQENWVTESVTIVETVETEPVETETITTTTVETEENPQPQQDPTWWETYQNNHPSEDKTVEKGPCPCPDPNEPCPQCFDK